MKSGICLIVFGIAILALITAIVSSMRYEDYNSTGYYVFVAIGSIPVLMGVSRIRKSRRV